VIEQSVGHAASGADINHEFASSCEALESKRLHDPVCGPSEAANFITSCTHIS